MDGVLIIDKPEGITSHDVVNRARKVFKTKRVGHTGTLDPFATGVLVLLIGRATRIAKFLDKDEKEYKGLVRFGFETDTGDRTGKRKTGSDLSDAELKKILRTVNWNKLLSGFCGEIRQVPPMHSAKKIGGKRLYSLARQGKEIERRAVPVTISALEILETAGDTTMKFRIVCSAGTYIRTLAEDIGRKAGTGAHLQELRRTRSGRFSLDDALDLDYLEEMACPETRLITMREALADLPEVILPDNRIEKTRQGLPTRISQPVIADGSAVKMIDENGSLAAIGIYENAEKNVWPKVVLI